MKRLTAILLAGLLFGACASATKITRSPDGTVTMDLSGFQAGEPTFVYFEGPGGVAISFNDDKGEAFDALKTGIISGAGVAALQIAPLGL